MLHNTFVPSSSLGEVIYEANYPVRIFDIPPQNHCEEHTQALLGQMHQTAIKEDLPISATFRNVLLSVYPTSTPLSLTRLEDYITKQTFTLINARPELAHSNAPDTTFLTDVLDEKYPDLTPGEVMQRPNGPGQFPLSAALSLLDNQASSKNILASYCGGRFVLPLNFASSLSFRAFNFQELDKWVEHCEGQNPQSLTA